MFSFHNAPAGSRELGQLGRMLCLSPPQVGGLALLLQERPGGGGPCPWRQVCFGG